MAMMVAYWHKDGLDVYRYNGEKPVRYASGRLDELNPIRAFGKKVLIVGRDLLLHTRKRYPPAPKEKLLKAVGVEIGDIFPLSKPAFHCRVFESFSTYTVLDIWAWESEPYSRLKAIFPFHHVVPEDIAYTSTVPEVSIFKYKGITNILAHSGAGFLAGASYPASSLDEKDVDRFLFSLGRHRAEIKRIKIYGALPFRLKEDPVLEISNVADGDHPPCLDSLGGLNLGDFKLKGDYRLWPKADLISRVLIYLILGYGLMLYLTLRNYDQAGGEMRQRLEAIERKIEAIDTGPKVKDYTATVDEINEKLGARPSPLKVMNLLARRLPAGSSVTRLVMNDNNVEVTVSSKDPLSVVKALGGAGEIKKAGLKGAPARDRASGSYNFVVTMELLR